MRSNSRRASSTSASPPSAVDDDFVSRLGQESFDERGGDGVILDEEDEHRTVERFVKRVARRGSFFERRAGSLRAAARSRRSAARSNCALEDVGAFLVAAQRGVGTALFELQPHQRAMHDFLRRIEREQTAGGVGGVLPPPGLDLRGQQLAEDRERGVPVVEAAFGEPFVEAGKIAVEVIEQIAAINLGRGADRVQRIVRGENIEARDVDFDAARIESQRVAGPMSTSGAAKRRA